MRDRAQTSATTAAASATVGASADQPVEALWARRNELAAESRALAQAYSDARAKLPAWTRPGPRFLLSDGTFRGPISVYPMIEDPRAPEEAGAMRLVRPDFENVRGDFEWFARSGPAARVEARKLYRRRILKIVARLRQQREEERLAGLPAIEQRQSVVAYEIDTLQEDIEALPPSAARTAALILHRLVYLADDRKSIKGTAYWITVLALEALRSQLTGLLAKHADEILALRKQPLPLAGNISFFAAA